MKIPRELAHYAKTGRVPEGSQLPQLSPASREALLKALPKLKRPMVLVKHSAEISADELTFWESQGL